MEKFQGLSSAEVEERKASFGLNVYQDFKANIREEFCCLRSEKLDRLLVSCTHIASRKPRRPMILYYASSIDPFLP
jgi:hypothetical protein